MGQPVMCIRAANRIRPRVDVSFCFRPSTANPWSLSPLHVSCVDRLFANHCQRRGGPNLRGHARSCSIWLQRAGAAPGHVSVSHSATQPSQPGPQDIGTEARGLFHQLKGCASAQLFSAVDRSGTRGLGLEPGFEPSRPQAPAGGLHRAAQGCTGHLLAARKGGSSDRPRVVHNHLVLPPSLPGRAWQLGGRGIPHASQVDAGMGT